MNTEPGLNVGQKLTMFYKCRFYDCLIKFVFPEEHYYLVDLYYCGTDIPFEIDGYYKCAHTFEEMRACLISSESLQAIFTKTW